MTHAIGTLDNVQNKADSWKLFNRIAGRYDSLNRILSLGIDLYWRRVLSRNLPEAPRRVLDLATGTADQLIDIVSCHPGIESAVGTDLSEGMLALGKKKIAARGLSSLVTLQPADAQDLPFSENHFDATSISFGIRNVPDVKKAMREMLRVLRPGGRSLILEFSTPTNRLLRFFYFLYLRHLLPRIGGWLSGDASAYRYLNQTIEVFPCGEEFCSLLRDSGFVKISHRPLTFGIATLYRAEKAL